MCLGRGGFGEVYRARMKQPGGLTTTVALKVLLAGVSAESQPVERLRDEGRLLAQLEHPVIMRVIDITELEGRVALVIEYIAGEDLSECCRGARPVSQAGVVHIISEVASALDKAWSTPASNGEPLKLVHRDIKPANIRIGQHGQVKLLDFGIARSDEMIREARTATQMVVGSLHYMAPERFTDRSLGPEADIFGLGCCLFEGLSGEKLYVRLNGPRILALALDEPSFAKHLERRKLALREGTDPRVVALMEDCLSHAPEDRPTASELIGRCDELTDVLPGPSLGSWARARDWPVEGAEDGPMVGKSYSDTLSLSLNDEPKEESPAPASTLASTIQHPVDKQASSNRSTGFWAALVGGLGLVALGSAAIVAIVVVLAWMNADVPTEVFAPPAAPVVDEAPVAAPEPVVSPSPEPAVKPTPVVDERPGEGSESPVEAQPDEGAPEEVLPPDVAPITSPVRGSPAFGTVVIHGAQNVVLRGAKGEFGAGNVPAGAYTVFVDTGGGPQASISVRVQGGEELVLECNGLLTSCVQATP
ncbi:MAG: protein kinase [Rhodobacterales bacterium]|nr:protein kinase [Rhodobacterales bacterium]